MMFNMNMNMNMNEIPILYINLEKRQDRRLNAEYQLTKLNASNIQRFNALELSNPALGCSMSHMKCLEIAKKNNYENVFICEDDIDFLDPNLLIQNVNQFLSSDLRWNVLVVGGNNMLPYVPVNDYCIRIMNCQTTTGYIVNKNYYDTLIENYKEGIQLLLKSPANPDYRIDKYWMKAQQKDKWYMIIPPTVAQIQDYSDIEKKVTNYRKYMLDYNKVMLPNKS